MRDDRMNKKILALITAVIITTASSGAYAYSTYYTIQNADVQVDNSTVAINNSNITIGQNNTIIFPEPTPTPEPKATSTPSPKPAPTTTPTPTPAHVVTDCTLKIQWTDTGKPQLKILGSITNTGTETAYNVVIHVQTWFSNGTEAIIIDHKLNLYDGHVTAPASVNLVGNETYNSGLFAGMISFSIPSSIYSKWAQGYVDNDCISVYKVTASWDTQL